jgi:hypothetical protein
VEDFRDSRLPLDKGVGALKKLGEPPDLAALESYGISLRNEIERFLLGEAQPVVRIITSKDLICCELQLLPAGSSPQAPVIKEETSLEALASLRKLREKTSKKYSQWAYVDRSLRVFGDDTVQLFKPPRMMDWTRTQALNDADTIIAEILEGGKLPA